MLTVGVFGSSYKEAEKRVPIHPDHIDWIDKKLKPFIYFEKGYGERFGIEDEVFIEKCGGILSRKELFSKCDVALLPKPVTADLEQMKPNSILWGWPHCVQQKDMTQVAIDKKLTLIAWEAMHKWNEHGDWQMHIFHNNNEIAGYAGVLHALGLMGINGNYGPQRKAVVISFGSVSRGSIQALKSLGFHEIVVFTQRHYILVGNQIPGVEYYHFDENNEGQLHSLHPDRASKPFIDELSDADVIINGILQDTDHPLMFVNDKNELDKLKNQCLIIDVSCDENMGFYFAQPTTFANPTFKVQQIHYYAVDHTPSYLWNSASWEISNSLIPYLPFVMGGAKKWEETQTIKRAIEIQDGIIQNPKILSFQNRKPEYPHEIRP